MDQYLAGVICALIGAVVSIVTLIAQKKSDKVLNKIDEQTVFIEKERELRKRLNQKEKERDLVIHEMMILIMDTNLKIVCENHIAGTAEGSSALAKSEELKMRYYQITKEIEEIRKEYDIVMDMTSQFHLETERTHRE